MKWKKSGLIYEPDSKCDWNSNGYASVPTVLKITNDKLRIYFSSRDINNRNSVSYIEVEGDNPKNILYIHNKPIISPGKNGMFDDSGVMPSHAIDVNGEIWMYYIGWNIRNTIPYHNSIGLAISKDGGSTFEKFSEGPLFDRNYTEPYFNAAPYIYIENNLWKMWYLSNTDWIFHDGRYEPRYHIKYAESNNGIDWNREGKISINYKNDNEGGIVRACVLKDPIFYKMWYSYRNINNYRIDKNSSYRIGYAISKNGIDWTRKDNDVGITISKSGWDSEMIEYPFVYDFNEQRYMVYNGNTFGKTGFGYAILENN